MFYDDTVPVLVRSLLNMVLVVGTQSQKHKCFTHFLLSTYFSKKFKSTKTIFGYACKDFYKGDKDILLRDSVRNSFLNPSSSSEYWTH